MQVDLKILTMDDKALEAMFERHLMRVALGFDRVKMKQGIEPFWVDVLVIMEVTRAVDAYRRRQEEKLLRSLP